jgi:dienelactone hydrolase
MQVKVPGGNFANRVLPIRIHDLDSSDIKLFEAAIGGVLRSIDFIYKETGVNRQLRAKDDDIIKNPTQILYRDQVNKVALATREIIKSMVLHKEAGMAKVKETLAEDNIEKRKGPGKREGKPGEKESLTIPKDEPDIVKKAMYAKSLMKARYIIPAVILILIIAASILVLNHSSKVKWAKEEGLMEAKRLCVADFFLESFNLAKRLERYIPKDTVLKSILDQVSSYQTIITDPPEADIYFKEYSDTSGNWVHMGKSPVDSLQVPMMTLYRFRIVKAGYDTLFGAITTSTTIGARVTRQDTLSRKLWKSGELPEGMVYVGGYWDEVKNKWEEDLGFFLDKYEVTNKQYKEFVDQGGYRNRDYWKYEFIKEGKTISWDEAMAEFTDRTGRPGPSTWEAGDYPDGEDDYPVAGVSWYEATAYAEYAGKVLPTADHWDSGVGFQFCADAGYLLGHYIPFSNFNSSGPVEVKRKQGISFFGAYDMAGNVREWCWNKTNIGRIVAGGGYDSPTYMFAQWDHLPPFDRSPINGFRCAKFFDREKIPETAFRYIDLGLRSTRDITSETPVPESIFNVYKNQFLYDKKDLNAVIEMRDESYNDWIIEKVTFAAAYDNQRMIAYLILPKNAAPPYQTIIFFPGSYAKANREISKRHIIAEFDFIVNSGRAAVYPIYFGTWERYNAEIYSVGMRSHEYIDVLVRQVKDFSRTIDYLETRDDIDASKLAFFGFSWGGPMGAIITAVEDRLSLSILKGAGFSGAKAYPEANEINYITRVKVPTLMMNGRYDANFPLETNARPFFNLLGTPEKDKRLFLIESGHNFYKRTSVAPFLEWCDTYFGPPNYLKKE